MNNFAPITRNDAENAFNITEQLHQCLVTIMDTIKLKDLLEEYNIDLDTAKQIAINGYRSHQTIKDDLGFYSKFAARARNYLIEKEKESKETKGSDKPIVFSSCDEVLKRTLI